ncbi:MAG TPA: hypothetical protein VGL58_14730 [Caulobacteraceae bacterium]
MTEAEAHLGRLRRRFIVAMTITVVALILAMIAIAAYFALHVSIALWLFGAAILGGFASHGWLMLGLHDKAPA